MRPFALWFAGLLLGLHGWSGAQTTNPVATQPTPASQPARPAAPATRPAVSADLFLPRLGSDAFHQRQQAEQELIGMGEDGRPIIEELLHRPVLDREVRTRLEAALGQINEDRITGPSLITLHLKDADTKTVFAELSRQCYADLRPFPENLFEQADLPKITLDMDRQPFWTAMTQISDKTGIDLQQYNDGIRLMRGGFRMNSPYSSVQGPFLVVATQLTRMQSQMFVNGGGSTSDFTLTLVVYSEPKLHVLSTSSTVKLEEAVDDAGNSLMPTGASNRGYFGGSGGVWNLFAQLKFPEKNPGTKITRLRGGSTFTVQTHSQQVQIPDIKKVKDLAQVVGDMPVVFNELKKAGDLWELRLTANPQLLGPARSNQFYQTLQTGLRLLDESGQPFDHRGMRGNGNEFTLMFGSSVAAPNGRPTAEPAKIFWEVPTASKEVSVPFEFKDLPMPK